MQGNDFVAQSAAQCYKTNVTFSHIHNSGDSLPLQLVLIDYAFSSCVADGEVEVIGVLVA